MKILLALILSAALLHLGTPAEQLYNSETKAATHSNVGQRESILTTKPKEQVPNVQAVAPAKQEAPESQPETVVATQETVKAPEPAPQPLTDKQALMAQAGIPSQDWSAVEYIIHKESTWRPTAVNEIGCKGLGQSCPGGSGLENDCPNWVNDPVCQLKHFSKYAATRYGSWQQAMASWNAQGWW